jgi:methanogenic corrinoid protein MtbC1
MVSDFFEMDGWDTYYIGANAPIAGLREAIKKHKADILALSVTMPFNQTQLIDTIKAVREVADAKAPKIMVGGYAANSVPDLWQRVGADGYASNAEQAVRMAHKLLADEDISKQ